MQFVWNDLIARARVYVDDDHSETDGWIAPANWLTLAQVEYALLLRRWIRTGLVVPATADSTPFTGGSTTLSNVLALVGVAQDKGGYVRVLAPVQSLRGQHPMWTGSQAPGGISQSWMATASGDTVTVTLDPKDPDTSEPYFVRYVAAPAYVTDGTQTVDLPYGTDERLVLGIARRSHLKDQSASQLLERLIAEADAELAFTAAGRIQGDSPRVRRTPRWQRATRRADSQLFPSDPRMWIYP